MRQNPKIFNARVGSIFSQPILARHKHPANEPILAENKHPPFVPYFQIDEEMIFLNLYGQYLEVFLRIIDGPFYFSQLIVPKFLKLFLRIVLNHDVIH